jgi:hypothetical protein
MTTSHVAQFLWDRRGSSAEVIVLMIGAFAVAIAIAVMARHAKDSGITVIDRSEDKSLQLIDSITT